MPPWDRYAQQGAQPAPAQPMQNADPIVRPAITPVQQAQMDRAAADDARAREQENRQSAQNTYRTMTPQEAASAGLREGGVYQVNGLGEIRTVNDPPAPPRAQIANPDRVPQLESILGLIGQLRSEANGNFAVGRTSQSVRDTPLVGMMLGQNRANVEGFLQTIEGDLIQQQLARLAQLNPQGVASLANSETEARRMAASIANLDPNQEYDQFITGVDRAEQYYQREYERLTGRRYSGPGGAAGTAAGETAAQYAGTNPADFDQNGNYIGPEGLTGGRATDIIDPSPNGGGGPGGGGGGVDPTANMGFFDRIGEAFTGNARRTSTTDRLPDWAEMPELNSLSLDSFQTALGTMATGPEETAQIIRSQFPNVRVRQDGHGNFILRSSINGQEYAIKPGFRVSDIPRTLGGVLSFTPAGRATTWGGAALASAGTQAAIETSQAAAGGDFNPGDVAMAGGSAGLLRAAEPYVVRGAQAARNAFRRDPVPSVGGASSEAASVLPDTPPVSGPQAPLAPSAQEEVANLARRATSRSRDGAQARRELANMARTNPEAADAARRLGMSLPVDVFSDSRQVRSLAGLTRSEVGSEAESAWRETMQRTAQQADEALARLGASPDLAQVSDDVLARMRSISDNLEQQAVPLREQVNAAIDPAARVDATNLQRLLGQMINDYGGIGEAKAAMTQHERGLFAMLGVGREAIRPTYARLNRLRDDIGRALNNRQGPWIDVNEAQLRRYYNALRDDQLAAVETLGGPEVASAQRRANDLFAEMFRQREATQEVFGQQLDRSLGRILTRAINSGRQGDAREIRNVLSRIPEDMRGSAVTSAIMSQSASRASHGGFSFANFAKTYGGLRANRPIHGQIARAIGPDGVQVLDDLLEISNRMASADANVLRTGKANQVMIDAIRAEGLVSQVFTTAARRAGAGVGGAAGAVVGGPTGAAVGATLGESVQTALQGASKSELQAIHSLLASDEFMALAAAGPDTAPQAIGRFNSSAAFNRFAARVGLRGRARRDWLTRISGILANDGRNALTANDNVMAATNIAAQPEQQQQP